MEELKIPVKGMACGGCVARVEAALKDMPGVSSVKVDLKAAEARMVIDPSVTDEEKVRRKIEQTGYHAGECSRTAGEPERKGGLLSKLRK